MRLKKKILMHVSLYKQIYWNDWKNKIILQ